MYVFAKRLFDIVFSLIGLAAFSPLMAIIVLLIRRDSEGPVLYRGMRVGKDGKPFKLLKFRTMVVNADIMGASSTRDDDPRITRVGNVLRRHKLDELPQLLNVLKGDMSLVGPRPQVSWAVQLYTPEERRLLSIRPGMTDIASVRFRKEGEILQGSIDPDKDYMEKIHPEKVRLGLEYVDKRSFWGDIRIILQTMKVMID